MLKIKTKTYLLVLAISLVLASCETNTIPFIGEYTYQTSGDMSVGTITGGISIPVSDKMGQMQIIKGNEKGQVIIIKTNIDGSIKKLSGKVNGKQIKIDEYTIEKSIGLGEIQGNARITVSSEGEIHDNIIIFNDTYSGFFNEEKTGFVGIIKNKDEIITIAKLND